MKTVIVTLENGLETGEYITRLPLAPDESTALQIFGEIVKAGSTAMVTMQYPMRILSKANGQPSLIPYCVYSDKDVIIRARLVLSMAEVPAGVLANYNKTIETYEAILANQDVVKKLAKILVTDAQQEVAQEDKAEAAVRMAEANAPKGDKKLH